MMRKSILLNACFLQTVECSFAVLVCAAHVNRVRLPFTGLEEVKPILFVLARKPLDNLLVGHRQQLVQILHPLLFLVLTLRFNHSFHALQEAANTDTPFRDR